MHTTGPWQRAEVSHNDKMVLVGSNFDASVEETKNGGMWVAQCIGPDRDANAKLVAASPLMLEALEGAAEWLSGWASAEPYLSKIRAAIAAAKS